MIVPTKCFAPFMTRRNGLFDTSSADTWRLSPVWLRAFFKISSTGWSLSGESCDGLGSAVVGESYDTNTWQLHIYINYIYKYKFCKTSVKLNTGHWKKKLSSFLASQFFYTLKNLYQCYILKMILINGLSLWHSFIKTNDIYSDILSMTSWYGLWQNIIELMRWIVTLQNWTNDMGCEISSMCIWYGLWHLKVW
jgi:hypothetical protein